MANTGKKHPPYDFLLDPYSISGQHPNGERPIEAVLIQHCDAVAADILAAGAPDPQPAVRFHPIRNVRLLRGDGKRLDILYIADDRPLCIVGEVKRRGARDLDHRAVNQAIEYRDKIRCFWGEDELHRYREFANAHRDRAIDSACTFVEHVFDSTHGRSLADSFISQSQPVVKVAAFVAVDGFPSDFQILEHALAEHNQQHRDDGPVALVCVRCGTSDSERQINSISFPGRSKSGESERSST